MTECHMRNHFLLIGEKMRMMMFGLTLILTLLAGCSSIPLSSLYQLKKLDILSTNPEFLSIAIRTHKAFNLREGDVLFSMGYHADDIKLDEQYIVKPTQSRINPSRIPLTQNDQHIIQLLLSDTDVKRMRALQQKIKQHKAAGGNGKGYMTVALVGICRGNDIPSGYLAADTFIKTEEITDYIPLVQDFNLRKQQEGWNNNIESWPLCSTP